MNNTLKGLYIENGLEEDIKRSLNYLIIAVTFGMVCFSITGGPALTGLARELGAGDFVYGVLMAMPVVGGVMQLYASYIIDKTGKRKKIFMTVGITSRLLWVPVGLVPYIVPMEAGDLRIWSVILLVTLVSMGGAFINVGFFSWADDLIPLNIRGRYFSTRSRISTIASLLAGLASAWLLDNIPGPARYTTVFFIAGIFGALDIMSFIRVKDVHVDKKHNHASITATMKKCFAEPSFRRYVLFWTVWGFAINLSAPFFNMYALGPLKMSFTQVTLTGQIACNLATIIFITRWGKFLDRFGSKPVLYISCITTSLLPVLWLFAAPGNYWPVLLFNIIGGAIWCGTDVTSQKMLITNTPEENRSMAIAIYFVITTILGNALAFITGGFLLDQVASIVSNINFFGRSVNQYQVLFVITMIMRLSAVLLFLPGVKDEQSEPMKNVYRRVSSSVREKITLRL